MKVGIIGAGTLGRALIDALKINEIELFATSRHEGIYKGIKITKNNAKVLEESDIILIAVKPDCVGQVINEIKNIDSQKIIISFAAGIRIRYYESHACQNIVIDF